MRKGKPKLSSVFLNGIITENPTFRLVLGTCPTLAISTQAMNGLGMGIAATFVLVFSNIFISLLRNFIPDKVRIPAYVLVICVFVTITDLVMHAYVPALYQALGVYIPLIVVNCIILARAEAFANKNSVVSSAVDGIGMGLGFTMAITLMGMIREFLSNGTIFDISVTGASFEPMLLFNMPPGGFLTFGLMIWAVNLITKKVEDKKQLRKEGER